MVTWNKKKTGDMAGGKQFVQLRGYVFTIDNLPAEIQR